MSMTTKILNYPTESLMKGILTILSSSILISLFFIPNETKSEIDEIIKVKCATKELCHAEIELHIKAKLKNNHGKELKQTFLDQARNSTYLTVSQCTVSQFMNSSIAIDTIKQNISKIKDADVLSVDVSCVVQTPQEMLDMLVYQKTAESNLKIAENILLVEKMKRDMLNQEK